MRDINSLLFGFRIDDINILHELITGVCHVGGVTRLISFDIKDDYTTIRYLNPVCEEERLQFRTDSFIDAKINGRNRHGKQVSYVKEAQILAIQIFLEDTIENLENGVEHTVEAIIDEDKVWRISDFIKL